MMGYNFILNSEVPAFSAEPVVLPCTCNRTLFVWSLPHHGGLKLIWMKLVLWKGTLLLALILASLPQKQQFWVLRSRSNPWWACGLTVQVLGGFTALKSSYNKEEPWHVTTVVLSREGSPPKSQHIPENGNQVPLRARNKCGASSWCSWRQWRSSWGFLGTWSGLENHSLFGQWGLSC